MPSHYKYYELYSVGCFTARTESIAVSYGFSTLLLNAFIFMASLSSDSEPMWSLGPPALFYMFAALCMFYAGWADRPSYCWVFLVINGFTISALAIAFVSAFLLDLNPQLLNQIQGFRGHLGKVEQTRTTSELRQLELGFLVLLLLQWMGQGLVWHYYRYLKHRKAEQFIIDTRPQARHGSFHISSVKRLQIGGKMMPNGK